MVETFAEVLAEEVAGDGGVEALGDAADGFQGVGEGFVVADVGDDGVVLIDVG